MIAQRAAAPLACLALSACTLGPNFAPPAPPRIAAWHDREAQGTRVSPSTNPDPRWWNSFGDPLLTTLMDRSIAGNPDVQQAVLRVSEAQQNVATARAAGLPTLNGTASYTREQLGARGILESDGVYSQINRLSQPSNPVNQNNPGLGRQLDQTLNSALDQVVQPINLFSYGLSASWELDLFGRVRRSVEQARADAQAQAEAANDALVMLEGQVAQAYVALRAAQALAATQKQNVDTAQETLQLTERRQRQGLATVLDVEQARTPLIDNQRQVPSSEKQVLQAIDRINTLAGQAPGTLDGMLSPPKPLPRIPDVVGIGVPSTLARRRPDIREAEAQLHAATAGIGVAVANFYPDVSLTGNLGIRATDASYLTRWVSHFYSAGPSLSLPIFQGGRLTAQLRLSRAQAAEAALKYRSTVLGALQGVEDALVAYRTDRGSRERAVETVKSAELTLFLSRERYDAGLSDFIQVLDAQRTLISARQQLVQSDMTVTDDVVSLYENLGGGWEESHPPPPPRGSGPPPAPAALDSLGDSAR